ncbi:hypothetical protein BLOT_004294 [Blomia tropicalis]|nr:hypothetical protein BLOT_004294 [Blomia tropicalis]
MTPTHTSPSMRSPPPPMCVVKCSESHWSTTTVHIDINREVILRLNFITFSLLLCYDVLPFFTLVYIFGRMVASLLFTFNNMGHHCISQKNLLIRSDMNGYGFFAYRYEIEFIFIPVQNKKITLSEKIIWIYKVKSNDTN